MLCKTLAVTPFCLLAGLSIVLSYKGKLDMLTVIPMRNNQCFLVSETNIYAVPTTLPTVLAGS